MSKLPINDLDLKQWKEYDHVWTNSWWDIPKRDTSNGHKLDYHGNFVPQIVQQALWRYTKAGDVVLDPFIGSGTTAIECLAQGRKVLGVDIQAELITKLTDRFNDVCFPDFKTGLDQQERVKLHKQAAFVHGNSASVETTSLLKDHLAALGNGFAQLVILHPPYDDIIKFSDHRGDLSNLTSTDEFYFQFELMARNCYRLLEPGRYAILVIGDKYRDGELVPLGFECMDRMRRTGFRLKGTAVKSMVGNEAKGKNAGLWRRRALAGGFFTFDHEYVMVFQRALKESKRR
jgi:16S rRNA G966 N2-methylase RsmD